MNSNSAYAQLDKSLMGDYVGLPFAAPVFWWTRGDKSNQADIGSGVRHYGGWACDAPGLNELGIDVPAFLINEHFTPSTGNPYEVYATRYLNVAFVGKRSRWGKDRDATGAARGNARSHLQALAVAGIYDKDAKTFSYWMPVVLSAKGLASKTVSDCINEWNRRTGALRNKHFEGLPAWIFYASIGTFGAEMISQVVGTGNNKSYITPAKLAIPDEVKVTQEWLQRRYVGDEVAKLMLELNSEAEDWLHAWDKSGDDDEQESAPAPVQTQRQPSRKGSPPMPEIPDSELPF